MAQKLSLALLIVLAVACGKNSSVSSPVQQSTREPANSESLKEDNNSESPKTPDLETKSNKDTEIDEQTEYYVQSNLKVRSGPSLSDEVLGTLNINSKVKVIEKVVGGDWVEVQIISTKATIKPSTKYFVSFKYLHETPRSKEEASEISKPGAQENNFFIVQNIATERMRVYEKKCETGVCRNKMVLETKLAVGEAKGDTKTVLGSFKISKWVKFYQDGAGLYPSWYDPAYPPVPEKGKGFGAWRDKKVMPNGQGGMRGAFGWYTALVGPNSYSQWTHGTIGWGVDKQKYINITRNFFVNLVADPRSHGCSRTDNESIAYLRHLVPVGTPLFKIYAEEKLYDANLAGYSEEKKPWQYIMTKNGVRVDGQKADRAEVLNANTPEGQWLEEGTYEVDAYPEAKNFNNRYGAKKENIKGVYYVDVGLFDGYTHPAGLTVGGAPGPFPEYLTYKLSAPVANNK